MTTLRRTVEPAVEPITLAEAKAWLRITWTDTDDDAVITALITAARQACESWTQRAFITQTWRYALDSGFARSYGGGYWADEGRPIGLELPKPPLIAVSSVAYYTLDNLSHAFDATNYFVDVNREPGSLSLNQGYIWPVSLRHTDSLVITYTAGYGATAASVPLAIRTAIRMLLSQYYESREGEPPELGQRVRELGGFEMPPTVQAILAPYRIYG